MIIEWRICSEIQERLTAYLQDQCQLIDEADDEPKASEEALREELETGIERLRKIIEERSEEDG